MKRIGVCLALLILCTAAFAAPALAAAPGNDTYSGRTVIGAIPFSDSLDTTQATTDADDSEANSHCGAPATDASVWYELTTSSPATLVVDVSKSTYSAGVIVVTGSPGSFSLLTCGPRAVAFSASAGVSYAILAFDDQLDGGGNGGTLNLTVEQAPPPPTVDLTVDPYGSFNPKTGSASITGTITCTGVAQVSYLQAMVRQQVGRFVITGFGFSGFICDGTAQRWRVEVFPSNGLFKGGQAATVTFAVACGPFFCGRDFVERTVVLRG